MANYASCALRFGIIRTLIYIAQKHGFGFEFVKRRAEFVCGKFRMNHRRNRAYSGTRIRCHNRLNNVGKRNHNDVAFAHSQTSKPAGDSVDLFEKGCEVHFARTVNDGNIVVVLFAVCAHEVV